MCAPDPNAGIRMQARVEKMKKDTQYKSESIKYWNRETQYLRGRQRIATGLSRAKSDTYVKALYALGQSRKQLEGLQHDKGQLPSRALTGGSYTTKSRNYGRKEHLKQILNKQAALESSIDTQFGRNMDANMTKLSRFNQIAKARNRERLGVRPEYGAPVMMPPKGDTTMANLSIAMQGVSSILAFAAMSDVRLKENIEQVGVSNDGHKIYEWNYKIDKNSRYRGVIAQEVVKINPMAVGIKDDYLTVDYSKIDVNMEVV